MATTKLGAWSVVLVGMAFAATASLPAQTTVATAPAAAPHDVLGRLETHGGLRLLRVWGTPEQRGYAHGFLMAKEIAAVAIAEFTARFARRPGLLVQARAARPRLIEYPDDVAAELRALFQGLVDAKVDLDMPELGRAFDLEDLLVANALDVFGLMGCSGFTVWGERVVGGGVLTGRNFDWPYTGPQVVDDTIVLVEHLADGRAVASVTWPGFVGVVTGISSDGAAVFLHVGSAKISMTPEPGSWPTATAARAILEHAKVDDGAATFAEAQRLLGFTSPPAGFLTRVVLPQATGDAAPVAVFETDVHKSVREDAPAAVSVVTNHFTTRHDGRDASRDSLDRARRVQTGLDDLCTGGDRRVDVAEAWQVLQSVQRGGGHAFGTLHALVFRCEPWCFELRLATITPDGLVAASSSERRFALTRAELFATGEQLGR